MEGKENEAPADTQIGKNNPTQQQTTPSSAVNKSAIYRHDVCEVRKENVSLCDEENNILSQHGEDQYLDADVPCISIPTMDKDNSSLLLPASAEENTDLPLSGTVVFVDVRAENENRSKAVSREVEKLGSVVVTKINSIVTHVVFKNGRNSTISQLKKYPHIHVVSVLWVDACKTTTSRVDEKIYAVDLSECQNTVLILPARVKRVKSLQPKTLEEDVNNSGKKADRRRKRLREKGKTTGDTPPDQIICFNSQEYIKSSDLYKLVASPRVIPDTPWIFNYIKSGNDNQVPNDSSDDDDTNGSFINSDTENSFTNVIQLSPGELRKRSSSSLLRSFIPKRLSAELEATEESFLIIDKPMVSDLTHDKTIDYSSLADFEKSGEGSATSFNPFKGISSFNQLDDSPNSCIEAMPIMTSLTLNTAEGKSLETNISIESRPNTSPNQINLNHLVNLTNPDLKCVDDINYGTLPTNMSFRTGNSERENLTVDDSLTIFRSSVLKKKRLLSNKVVPFQDSPLAEDIFLETKLDEAITRSDKLSSSDYNQNMKGVDDNMSNKNQVANAALLTDIEKLANGKTLSIADLSITSNSLISKKKKLFSKKAVPFKDSPIGEDVDIVRPLVAQYPVMKNSMDPSLAMFNVDTSRKLTKLKGQQMHLLKPFLSGIDCENSPDCSFKTVENLQLRCPERKHDLIKESILKKKIDSAMLIEEMNDLNVNSCFQNEVGNKRVHKVDSRRSSGIDFKINKNMKNAGSVQKTKEVLKLKDPEAHNILLDRKQKYEVDYSLSCFNDDSDSDDAASIASNVSFVHDKTEGLIICSQESHVNDTDRNKNVDDSDSGISDSDVGCIGGNSNQMKSQSVTSNKKFKNYKAKSPKCHIPRCTSFSPYKSSKIKSSLVSTSLHLSEQTFLKAMLKNLGGFVLRRNVANDTTHVIAGSERRTLNILYAITQGCWILSPKWVADSAEGGKWLKEANYEMYTDFPIGKTSRISRIKNGKSFFRNMFSSMPSLYIAEVTSPPSDELAKLITLCGGKVTNSIRKAGIGVGMVRSRRRDLCIVTEKWILDSISKGSVLPTENYIIIDNRESSPGF